MRNTLPAFKTPHSAPLYPSSSSHLEKYFLHYKKFADAARQLKKEAPRIQFGKIDVTHQHDLRKEFNIQAFPTVKFFVNGSREDPIDCKGVRKASTFVTWVKRRTGPSTVLINSTDQAEAIIKADDLAVIGFFRVIIWKAQKAGFCSSFGTYCLLSTPNPTHPKDEKNPKPRIHQKNPGPWFSLHTKKTPTKQKKPQQNCLHLFFHTSRQASQAEIRKSYTTAHFPNQYLGRETLRTILFVLVDTNEARNGRIFEYFRIRDIDVPAVRILNLTSEAKYKMPADEVTMENLKEFCQSYLNGKAKQHLSSEEIPQDWDKTPVKVLVGKNFNSIIFNKTMNVFVMFYAPWSHECRKLLLIWDELGEQYKSHKDVMIAKIDVTANDLLSVGLDRYPFFTLFPAGPQHQVRSCWGRLDYTKLENAAESGGENN
uniref:Protein disulfide isomerase like, testis expressed n=1 Tax=Catharus ustulatus TaxID=91951 RepID=A0A8C3UWY4_CATUS